MPHTIARRIGSLCLRVGISFSVLGTWSASCQEPARQTLAVGVPLYVQIDHTVNLEHGVAVTGHILHDIYSYNSVVIPEGSVIDGVIKDLVPIHGTVRVKAILDGDVTPLREPVISFTSLHLPSGDLPIVSEGQIHETQLVRFGNATKSPSMMQQAKTAVTDRVHDARDAIFAPGKKDRALRLLYSQLPYHPQRLWAGTQVIADLQQPLLFAQIAKQSVASSLENNVDGVTVTARLVSPLSSDVTQRGSSVVAIVSKPVFDSNHQLLLPEGSHLTGFVSQVKPSQSFSRNGQLRFSFQSVQRDNESEQAVRGILSGAEGAKSENVTVDAEGQTKANPDKNRFVAPLLLGAFLVAGRQTDSDGSGVGRTTFASNGFGLIARVIALTVNDRDVATGFGSYALAKSIYFRFLAKGHAVEFPAGTLVEVQLASRDVSAR